MQDSKQITAWRRPESMVYVTDSEYGDLDRKWDRLVGIISRALEINDWADFEDVCRGVFYTLLGREGANSYRRQDPRKRPPSGRGRFVVVAGENRVFLAGVSGVQIEIWAQGRERSMKMCCRLTFLQDAEGEDEIFADRNWAKRVMDAIDEVLDADQSMDRVGYRARSMTVYHPELFFRARYADHHVFSRGSKQHFGGRVKDVTPHDSMSRKDHHPVWCVTPKEGEEVVLFANSAAASDLGLDAPQKGPRSRDMMVFARIGQCHFALRPGDRAHRVPRDRITVFMRN